MSDALRVVTADDQTVVRTGFHQHDDRRGGLAVANATGDLLLAADGTVPPARGRTAASGWLPGFCCVGRRLGE
jgi:hypothetical protein